MAGLYHFISEHKDPKQIELIQKQTDEILKNKDTSSLKDYLPSWQSILKSGDFAFKHQDKIEALLTDLMK